MILDVIAHMLARTLSIVLLCLLVTGCGADSDSTTVRNRFGMEFVAIPASDDDWKAWCEQEELKHSPVRRFYLQRSELTRAEVQAAAPNSDLGGYPDTELGAAASVLDWVAAVRLTHEMSARDPDFDYRLPTVSELRYAYVCSTQPDSPNPHLMQMANGNWEFATVSGTPTVDDISNKHNPRFQSASYVMDAASSNRPHFVCYAHRTPPTGDDGIDEITGIRLVLIPKTDSKSKR